MAEEKAERFTSFCTKSKRQEVIEGTLLVCSDEKDYIEIYTSKL